MAVVDLSKVMNLADAQEIYKDLRDRIKNAGSVKDVKVDGASVLDENGVAIIVLPTVPVTDVQVNGSSILNNGIATIPLCDGGNTHGLVRVMSSQGVGVMSGGILKINPADSSDVKGGAYTAKALVPNTQHRAVFFGLSKVAGVDLKDETVTLGTYPDSSKQAIQKMLGLDGILGDFENSAVASKAYAIGETFIYNGKRYRATAAIAISDVIAPGTNCEPDPLDGRYIKKTDLATSNSTGVVKIRSSYGIDIDNNTGELKIFRATGEALKTGTDSLKPITPSKQHDSVFYGLSKAAGVDLANETVTVGTYPAASKTAIRGLIGAISKDDIAGSNGENRGVAFFNGNYGVGINSETGGVYVSRPGDDVVKAGVNDYKPIVPSIQHKSVFYALSKLAGVDLASNASEVIGVYPQNAKTAIQTMLGIEADIPLVETVTGATASITGMPNVRYICDTAISELTITPPASGSIVVRFTAGSNCIVVLPQTVKLPEWFDISSLEAGTTYEIIITDGVYGGVMSWA